MDDLVHTDTAATTDRGATGLGVDALDGVLVRIERRGGCFASRRSARMPHIPANSEAGDLSVPVGRAIADGTIRLQAASDRIQGTDLPESCGQGQRLTAMSATQCAFSCRSIEIHICPARQIRSMGQRVAPAYGKIVDDLTFIKSVHTEAINHDPAVTFFQTGSQIAGRPSMGSWVSYGMGCETHDLPAFVVMISPGQGGSGQPLYDRLWGSGFLPSRFQGIKFRSIGDPVLYLTNPKGFPAENRRVYLDTLKELNEDSSRSTAIRRSRRELRSTRWHTECKRRYPN